MSEINPETAKWIADMNARIALAYHMDALVTDAKAAFRWQEFKGHESGYYTETHRPLRFSLSLDAGSLQGVLVMVDVTDLRDMVTVLRNVRRRGYALQGRDECAEIKRTSWTFRRPDEKRVGMRIIVSAFLPWSGGSVCEYVQVGTKQEPVYELRCGGEKVDVMPHEPAPAVTP